MKISILILTAATFVTGVIVSSCNSPEQEVQKEADEKGPEKDILQDDDAYLTDLENYRLESEAKLAENEQKLADFKAKVEHEKTEMQLEDKKKIEELEQRNNELKARLGDFDVEDKSKWEKFKAEFSHDMKEFGNAFKSLVKDDVK